MNVIVKRTKISKIVTIGNLEIISDFGKKLFKCITLELPDLQNQKKISRIPSGIYNCKKIISPKFGNVYQVTNVVNRDKILIHAGNFKKDTHGCILLGHDLHKNIISKEHWISSSKATLQEFMLILPSTFQLNIKD